MAALKRLRAPIHGWHSVRSARQAGVRSISLVDRVLVGSMNRRAAREINTSQDQKYGSIYAVCYAFTLGVAE